MVIATYPIGGYYYILLVILLMVINDYSIGGYFIGAYWCLFY
jgi:hypothetical protein